MRNFAALECGRIKTDDSAFENVEPLHPTELHTLREEDLHTDADTKQRCALGNDTIHRIHQATLSQPIHASTKGTHPGQNYSRSGFNAPGVAGHLGRIAHLLEAFLHATQISHTVIDDGDHMNQHYSVVTGKNQGEEGSHIALA